MILATLWILLGLAIFALGVVGLVAPALPGPPLMYLGILILAWVDGFRRLDPLELIFLGLVAALVTILDTAAGIYGARWFGGTRWGMFGAALGLVVGLPFGVAGWLIGPFVGVLAFESRKAPNFRAALKAGTGSVIGLLAGTVLKVAMSVGMVVLAFWWAATP